MQACRGWLESHPGFEPDEPRRWNVRETAGGSVLVLAPHPDDEIIGCGGTLLRYREAGAVVSVVYLTEGSGAAALADVPVDNRAAVRRREAEKVAEHMGFEEVLFWGRPDGRLACTDDVVERMRALLDHLRPSVIFVPFCTDPHPDHVAANRILVEAIKQRGGPGRPRPLNVLGYEVWGMVPPHVYCPIDTEIGRKLQLLLLYRTGMKAEDYVRYTRDLGAYRAYTLTGRTGFVEVFAHFNEAEYLRVVEPADSAAEHRTTGGP
ncbi:MAG TPA: PIG-L family deacetylase [Phycisphaerales bacterium]|nr:PIG-L family deacetylase [Phycisphaerales bacterium]